MPLSAGLRQGNLGQRPKRIPPEPNRPSCEETRAADSQSSRVRHRNSDDASGLPQNLHAYCKDTDERLNPNSSH